MATLIAIGAQTGIRLDDIMDFTTDTFNVRDEFHRDRPVYPKTPDPKNLRGQFDSATKEFYIRPLYPNENTVICPLRLVKEQCARIAHLPSKPFNWLFRQATNKGPSGRWQLLPEQAKYATWRQATKTFTEQNLPKGKRHATWKDLARRKVVTQLSSCPNMDANTAHAYMGVKAATIPIYARRVKADVDNAARRMAGQNGPAPSAPPPPVAHAEPAQPFRVANTAVRPCQICRSPTWCRPGCPVQTEAARAPPAMHSMSGPHSLLNTVPNPSRSLPSVAPIPRGVQFQLMVPAVRKPRVGEVHPLGVHPPTNHLGELHPSYLRPAGPTPPTPIPYTHPHPGPHPDTHPLHPPPQ